MEFDHLILPTSVGIARFHDCGIVLDLNADRYWRVNTRLAFVLDWMAGRVAGPIDPADVQQLAAIGLVSRRAEPEPYRPRPHMSPARSPLDEPPPSSRPRFRIALMIVSHALAAALAVRVARLSWLLHGLADRPPRPHRSNDSLSLEHLAVAYARYRPLLPTVPRCLPDTIAFLWLAARYGHRPALVFGVTAHPFGAHCWAQDGATVLNDRLDHVRVFTPILSL